MQTTERYIIFLFVRYYGVNISRYICSLKCQLTKGLKFSRVEVIEETKQAFLHLLHIRDVCEEGMLSSGSLVTQLTL